MRINASLIGVKQRSRFDSSVQLTERLDPQCQCLLFADDASHNLGSTQVLHERGLTPMPVRCRQISHVANKLLPWRIGMEFTVFVDNKNVPVVAIKDVPVSPLSRVAFGTV